MLRFAWVAATLIAAGVTSEAQNLSGLAAGVLEQSKLARQAVVARDSAAALDHIRQGKILANEIFQAASSKPRPVVIQISQSVETISTYSPVKGRTDGLFEAKRLKKDSTVRDVDATITTESLDVTSASAHLDAAQEAVVRADWPAADSELGAIPNSIIRTRVEGTMPLLEARQNLRLARMRVLEDKYKDARAPLEAAVQNLAEFEKLSPGPHAQDAAYLREKIEAYAHVISRHPADALMQIDAWLDPIEKWYDEGTR